MADQGNAREQAQTNREKADVFWTIYAGVPVLVTTLGIKRAWYHMRSGEVEWKEQNPRRFTHESQAWWYLLECEVAYERWRGWRHAKGYEDMMEHVKNTAACERIYDKCCKYHRAIVHELAPRKGVSE